MSKKCIVIGMDGVSPQAVLRLIQQGRLPNFQRMMQEGTFVPHCLSSVPTSTPENWTTIATGAWNGTHQVMNFQTFQPPELHGNWMAGYTSAESEAEFIWDAVERAGKQSIILKYPASHPPTMKTGVQVCGCHVRPCAHQIDGAHMFATAEPRSTPLSLRPLSGKVAFPTGGQPALTGELTFAARGMGAPSVGAGMDERSTLYGVPDAQAAKGAKPEGVSLATPVCKLVPPGKTYYLFVFSTDGKAYDRVIVARDAAGQDRMAALAVGEWSPWFLESFKTVDGRREGTFRFKLEALSPDASLVKLYTTQIMDVDGYTFPASVGRELYGHIGPFITDIGWEGLGHDRTKAWFHESLTVDLANYQHGWFVKAIEYLSKTRDWTLCMLQAHCIDCANHHCLHLADPAVNPHRELGDRYLKFIETLYESLDRMVGRIMALADEETAIFVVSDHGGLPSHLHIEAAGVLQQAGFLARDGQGNIDWSRTCAYVQNALFVNVNLQGREPRGIVPPEQFDRTCDEVIAVLHAYVEPTTGLHPFNLVLRKADMRYLGLYGDPTGKKIGDIVFTLREGFGGNHGAQLSTAAWGLGANTSLLIMSGPGIRRGVQLERTAWLTDIVPTICKIIGVAVPRQTEGAVLYQAFEDSML